MKTCVKCGAEKTLDEFHRDNAAKDGRRRDCKQCLNARTTARRSTQQGREAQRAYNASEKARAMRQRYDRTEDGRAAKIRGAVKWQRNNRNKARVQAALRRAVRAGKVLKPERCEGCGTGGRIMGHHDDYSKPLQVRWLCYTCHYQWHAKHGEGLNP